MEYNVQNVCLDASIQIANEADSIAEFNDRNGHAAQGRLYLWSIVDHVSQGTGGCDVAFCPSLPGEANAQHQ